MHVVAECTQVEDAALGLLFFYQEGTVSFMSNYSWLDTFWDQRIMFRLFMTYLHPSRTQSIDFRSITKAVLFNGSLAI